MTEVTAATRRRYRVLGFALIAAAIAIAVLGRAVDAPRERPAPGPSSPLPAGPQPVAVPPVSDEQLAALPESSTHATILAAPLDGVADTTEGIVAHPKTALAVFTAPGGLPFARLPVQQLGSDTWLPVIARKPGWVQVMLPSRPNGSTGWLDASRVRLARTRYALHIRVSTMSLRVTRDGHDVGHWTVALGAPATPTPVGRTFLLASVIDHTTPGAPIVVPLGTHSPVLDSYAGGPATVALHTWPDPDVMGEPVSHGCIRVPNPAMEVLRTIPLGTVVHIDNH